MELDPYVKTCLERIGLENYSKHFSGKFQFFQVFESIS